MDENDPKQPTATNGDSDERRHPEIPETATNTMLPRRDPVEQSEAGLVSRDYQSRHGGPKLIASWPLGPAPGQTEAGNVTWTVTSDEFVQLQRNLTVNHLLGPIEYTKIYAGVRGRGHVTGCGTFTLRLRTLHLEGAEYEIEIGLTNTDAEPFMTPMIEFTPDARDYREHTFIGREMYGGYVFEAKVSHGTGHLDQGTAVHLWSE